MSTLKPQWQKWFTQLSCLSNNFNFNCQQIKNSLKTQNKITKISKKPILKLPLQFTYPPVQIISKELTKLNSKHNQRIVYLGPRWSDSLKWHKKYSYKYDNMNIHNNNNKKLIIKNQHQHHNNNENIDHKNQYNPIQHHYFYDYSRITHTPSYIQSHSSFTINQQFYYRAFQGMNPTLQQSQNIIFQSRKQSMNLDCVVKIKSNQYDLFLRVDTNTKASLFWYYFEMEMKKINEINEFNGENKKLQNHIIMKSKKIKLNICNISKSNTLYQKNLKPYIKRTIINKSNLKTFSQQWTQGLSIQNCQFQQKKLRYSFINDKISYQSIYQLSFQLQIKENQIISLAYCIPYTYTNLINHLIGINQKYVIKNRKCIENLDEYLNQKIKLTSTSTETQMIQNKQKSQIRYKHKNSNIKICKLGQTLTGVQIPVIIIGNIDEYSQKVQQQKKVVIMTSRIHPGQSNSSIITQSLINQLCQLLQQSYNTINTKQTSPSIFQKNIFLIIPMLNPDGVILGNGRTCSLGQDLNREFTSPTPYLHPQIFLLKQLISSLQQYYPISLYLDFHGHSKKKNMFIFGPNYNITQLNYYKCRVFPKILSKRIYFFRYFGCKYIIEEDKKSTARAVMLEEYGVEFFFTIQTSIGRYYDYINKKDQSFDRQKWVNLGKKVVESLKQYFQGIEDYEKYVKKIKKNKNIQQKEINTSKKQKKSTIQLKDNKQKRISVIKYLEQIQNLGKFQQNNYKRSKNESLQSDSYNSEEYLSPQKSKQFVKIITNFNNNIKQKISLSQQSQKNQVQKNKNTQVLIIKRKEKNQNDSDQNKILRNILSRNNNISQSRNFTQNFKSKLRLLNSKSKSRQKVNIFIQDNEQSDQKLQNTIQKLEQLQQKQYRFEDTPINDFFNKVNFHFQKNFQTINAINLSKMIIQTPKTLRYTSNTFKTKKILLNYRKNQLTNPAHPVQQPHQQQINPNRSQPNKLTLFTPKKPIVITKKHQSLTSSNQKKQQNQSYNPHLNPYNYNETTPRNYPVSFYRIKYQTSQKRYRQKQRSNSNQMQKNNHYHNNNRKEMKITKLEDKNKLNYSMNLNINFNQQKKDILKQRLFFNINKVQ